MLLCLAASLVLAGGVGHSAEAVRVAATKASPDAAVASTTIVPATASPPVPVSPAPMRLPPPPTGGEQWKAGLHYSVLLGQVKTAVAPGKVEVRELFMYTSPLSYEIQPILKEWLAHKPQYIEFVRSPSIVFPHARLQARTFFVLRELGREDLHDALFAWIFEKEHYSTYHTIKDPDEVGYLRLNLEFAAANKLDQARFLELYGSKSVNDKVIDAEIATHGYLVTGTSTFVVNGRYSTSVQRIIYPKSRPDRDDYLKLFNLIEYLCASEVSSK